MPLRIAKLTDMKPTKLTLTIDAGLQSGLRDYAKIYAETYGESASIEQLAPVMLQSFLNRDAAFKRARKSLPKTTEET